MVERGARIRVAHHPTVRHDGREIVEREHGMHAGQA